MDSSSLVKSETEVCEHSLPVSVSVRVVNEEQFQSFFFFFIDSRYSYILKEQVMIGLVDDLWKPMPHLGMCSKF